MPSKVADPQDTKPRKPPRRPDGLVTPHSAEEEPSTRVRVGHYVTEPSGQRFTVLSATPVPPSDDYASSDSDHTTVDDPLQRRRVFEADLTSPERTRTDPENHIGHLAPMLPPLEAALGPGAFDEDLFSQDMWPSDADLDDHLSHSAPLDLDPDDLDGDLDAHLDAHLGANLGARSDTGVDTGLHNVPSVLEEQLETTRHRLETARHGLELRPQRSNQAPPTLQPDEEGLGSATSVRRLPLPAQSARPTEPEPPPRNLALPAPPQPQPLPVRTVSPRPVPVPMPPVCGAPLPPTYDPCRWGISPAISLFVPAEPPDAMLP